MYSARRKIKNVDSLMRKSGGGHEGFKSGFGEQDGDYDGIDDNSWFGGKDGGRTKPRIRWNRFKWILLCSNIFVSIFVTLSSLPRVLIVSLPTAYHLPLIALMGRRPPQQSFFPRRLLVYALALLRHAHHPCLHHLQMLYIQS